MAVDFESTCLPRRRKKRTPAENPRFKKERRV